MLVAALLELAVAKLGGEPLDDVLRPALATIGIEPDLVASETVWRGGIAARAFTVAEAEGFATFDELIGAVGAAPLPTAAAAAAMAVARRMAAAEDRVHGAALVHLHELSGLDTVVDLVCVALLIDVLAPRAILATPPALGSGLVETAHGLVSVPAPGVLELLKGWPTAGASTAGDGPLGELTTPTGAALLAEYAQPCAGLPSGRIEQVGYGAGAREVPGRPNVLRAVLLTPGGEALFGARARPDVGEKAHDELNGHVLLETNVDDLTPELLAYAADALRAAGALDVWLTHALMKKGRAGAVLHVLADAADRQRLAEIIFAETSSFGLRVVPVARMYAVDRRERVSVAGHEIAVRLATVDGRLVTVSPEYEDVRRVARASGRPAKAIYEAAQAMARARFGDG